MTRTLFMIPLAALLSACGPSDYEVCLGVEADNAKALLGANEFYSAATDLEANMGTQLRVTEIAFELDMACRVEGDECPDDFDAYAIATERAIAEGQGASVDGFLALEALIDDTGLEFANYYGDRMTADIDPNNPTLEAAQRSDQEYLSLMIAWAKEKAIEQLGFSGWDDGAINEIAQATCNRRGLYQ